MAGRICRICMDGDLMKRANGLIAQGELSDQKIADMLGFPGDAGRVLVHRHRRAHVEAPALAIAKAANRGRANVEKREEMVAAAERGDDVTTFLNLENITRDVRKVSKSLKRARKATESAGQFSVMTGVVAQEHKNLELRGKLGNHAGFTPQKLADGETMPTFNLTINLSGQTKKLEFTDVHPNAAPVLDLPAVALPAPEGIEEIEPAAVEDIPVPAPRRGRPRRAT